MATKITLNRAGVAHLLKVDVRADLERRGRAIAAAAGPGFEMTSEVGPNRARVEVHTVTFAARRVNAKDMTLVRALDAGRQ